MKTQHPLPNNERVIALYRSRAAPVLGRVILLLTTKGRKSGLPRITPLQYETVDGCFYIGSGRGNKADWYRNLAICPEVEVQVKDRRFYAFAEPVTDPVRIADFLELRLKRHPFMVRLILAREGLPLQHTRAELEAHAARLALVILHPRTT